MITQKFIDQMKQGTTFDVAHRYGRCTFVTAKLPNGFIINESSCSLLEKDFDPSIGESICRRKIEDKMWELYAFAKQESGRMNCVEVDGDKK